MFGEKSNGVGEDWTKQLLSCFAKNMQWWMNVCQISKIQLLLGIFFSLFLLFLFFFFGSCLRRRINREQPSKKSKLSLFRSRRKLFVLKYSKNVQDFYKIYKISEDWLFWRFFDILCTRFLTVKYNLHHLHFHVSVVTVDKPNHVFTDTV